MTEKSKLPKWLPVLLFPVIFNFCLSAWAAFEKSAVPPMTQAGTALFAMLVGSLVTPAREAFEKLSDMIGKWVVYKVVRKISPEFAQFVALREYCDLRGRALDKFLYVPSRADVALPIDEMYVPLHIESAGATETFTHETLLNLGGRIRVVGEPGSGKSSLLKRMFLDACRLNGTTRNKASKPKLPILLELRRLRIPAGIQEQALGQWLFGEVREYVLSAKVFQIEYCFDTFLTTRGVLVFLDGLDEVSSTDNSRMRAAILQLSKILSDAGQNNTLVVTMRQQYHELVRREFSEIFGPVASLKKFSSADIYTFLSKWPFNGDGHQEVARILRDLSEKPTIRDLCGTPLILSMYVAQDQESKTQNIKTPPPETRTAFYSRLVEELLIRRRYNQAGEMASPARLLEEREQVLGSLAFEHLADFSQSSNSIPWTNAKITLLALNVATEETAEHYTKTLGIETGLIEFERDLESLRFPHLSFCEYFAALEAAEGRKEGFRMVLETYTEASAAGKDRASRFSEVIQFSSGLLKRADRRDTLEYIQRSVPASLFLRCVIEAQYFEGEKWSEAVISELEKLQDDSERWSPSDYQTLNLLNSVVRNAAFIPNADAELGILKAKVRLASVLGRSLEKSTKAFEAYANYDAASAFRLAGEMGIDIPSELYELAIQNSGEPACLATLVHLSTVSDSKIESWARMFVHCAMTNLLTAEELGNTPEAEVWNGWLLHEGIRSMWFLPKRTTRSFLTQSFDVSMHSFRQGEGGLNERDDIFLVIPPRELKIRLTFINTVRYVFFGGYLLFVTYSNFGVSIANKLGALYPHRLPNFPSENTAIIHFATITLIVASSLTYLTAMRDPWRKCSNYNRMYFEAIRPIIVEQSTLNVYDRVDTEGGGTRMLLRFRRGLRLFPE